MNTIYTKKIEINQTKIKGGCQLGRKVVTHNTKCDLPLVYLLNWSNKKTNRNYESNWAYIIGNFSFWLPAKCKKIILETNYFHN